MAKLKSAAANAAKSDWSSQELQLLKYHYPSAFRMEEVLEKIPKKTKNQIVYRAKTLAIVRGKGKGLQALSEKDIKWMVKNFNKYTNQEFADKLNCSIDVIRKHLHARKMFRQIIEYWTPEQVAYLKKFYKTIGNTEMAYIFNIKWPKIKTWTFKHIEKKCKYLNLKRTPDQLKKIKSRNTKRGAFKTGKTWLTRGIAKEGEIRIHRSAVRRKDGSPVLFKVIKTGKGFKLAGHYLYEKHFGKIPAGYVIGYKDRNNMNIDISNLEIITRAEHVNRYRRTYPKYLTELEKLLNQLKKKMKDATT